ncbi:uncharacterized protein LOC135345779 isoform X2 [Halichondria panicea]|uniref:uncharacterized protein LOC135345779 isoform X2 n=1 Tax=Halichondria panicea TaxID=6063 RepID=UPI00312B5BAF
MNRIISWFSGNEQRSLDGAKNDSDDDFEYYSATDHSNDSESTGSSVHVTEWSLDSQNSQLMLSIRRRDSEGVLEAMDESNKWILQQKIWYLDKKENLLEENGLSLVEDEERVFLEQCIETYLSSGPDNVTEISSETAIETETSNFKINPKLFEISINSNVPDVEYQTAETNVSRSLDDQIVMIFLTPPPLSSSSIFACC